MSRTVAAAFHTPNDNGVIRWYDLTAAGEVCLAAFLMRPGRESSPSRGRRHVAKRATQTLTFDVRAQLHTTEPVTPVAVTGSKGQARHPKVFPSRLSVVGYRGSIPRESTGTALKVRARAAAWQFFVSHRPPGLVGLFRACPRPSSVGEQPRSAKPGKDRGVEAHGTGHASRSTGGTGIHDCLKHSCFTACGFESRVEHILGRRQVKPPDIRKHLMNRIDKECD